MKVMVVDDSALMRKYLRQMLEKEDDIDVITARDGEDALEKLMRLEPDVITLDINMPIMDGLTCLSHIMQEHPTPTVMVSSLTEKGAVATFEALELGATDFIPKPGGTISRNIDLIEDEVLAKVRAAAGARPGKAGGLQQRIRVRRERSAVERQNKHDLSQRDRATGKAKLLLIGVSTGGPKALEVLLPNIPPDFPVPIMIAQHMPDTFTGVFAERMNRLCHIDVMEADRLTPLRPGSALIARGGADITLRKRGREVLAHPAPSCSNYVWHPSVSRMVESAASIFSAEEMICVQLTGMGDDGAREMAELYKKGARTIAESEQSATIFGMPERLIALDGAESVLPIEQIGDQLLKWT